MTRRQSPPPISGLLACPACCGATSETNAGHLQCKNCAVLIEIRDSLVDLTSWSRLQSLADGEFWGRFYGLAWEKGFRGFTDPRADQCPLIHLGIEEGSPVLEEVEDRTRFLDQVLEASGLRPGARALDLGTGGGWSAVHLARRGIEVVAVDPSREALMPLVEIAREESLPIRAVLGGVEAVKPVPDQFDLLLSLHALHHVEDLEPCIPVLLSGLNPASWIAIEDHVHHDDDAIRLWSALMDLATEEILPRYLFPATLERLGPDPSPAEGCGTGTSVNGLRGCFENRIEEARFVFLDILPFLIYLKFEKTPDAFRYSYHTVDFIQRALKRIAPERCEYLRLAGPKHPIRAATLSPSPPRTASRLMNLRELSGRELLDLTGRVLSELAFRGGRRFRKWRR